MERYAALSLRTNLLSVFTAVWVLATPPTWAGDYSDPRAHTLAEELMKVELQARKEVPAEAPALLSQVLTDAAMAAQDATPQPPRTRADALTVLAAIQKALADHHFEPPERVEDWPNTLGQALTLRGQSPPFYYVDCDIGALLFISVGQRLGWDLRLVEANQTHLFLRWHLPSGEVVNWDWNDGKTFTDAHYWEESAGETPQARALYLRSFSPAEASAYYLALIAGETADAALAEQLFVDAQPLQGEHPRFLNNLGWFYATHPGVPEEKRGFAVRYALAGWSYKPMNPNNMDTVACAFAAAGERERALRHEELALNLRPTDKSFLKNRDLISQGQRCAR